MRAVSFACLLLSAAADLRSTIYEAVIARSGLKSDCARFAALFAADAVYESPVGAGGVVGPAAIAQQCEEFNDLIGVDGSGWYPGPFFSSANRSAFTLQIRTVSVGGCKVDINGIVSIHYDAAGTGLLTSWQHHYDNVWDDVTLHGKCTPM